MQRSTRSKQKFSDQQPSRQQSPTLWRPKKRAPVSCLLFFQLFCIIGVFTTTPAFGQGACSGQGNAQLTLVPGPSPPAIGAPITLQLQGLAQAPFAILADVGLGPTTVPGVGTFCLDRGPRFRILLNGIQNGSPTIGADGTFSMTQSLPPNPALANRTFFLQAAIADAAAPNGFAISNKLDLPIIPSIVETFATTQNRDVAATTATWNGNGILVGAPVSARNEDFEPSRTAFLLPEPLTSSPLGSRFQMIFSQADVGIVEGEAIVGLSWGPQSNFVFASRYENVELKIGTRSAGAGLSLNPAYDANYTPGADNPVTVFQGSYDLSNAIDLPWAPWPAFTTDFEYAGGSVVVEVNVPAGGTTFQLFRNRSVRAAPRRRNIGPGGALVATNASESTQYHTRFLIASGLSVAQSTFYDSGSDQPDYFPAHVGTLILPSGTSFSIEYEGAQDSNRDGVPDPGTQTGFSPNVDIADGSRLVRFRLNLRGNRRTGELPRINRVAIPHSP